MVLSFPVLDAVEQIGRTSAKRDGKGRCWLAGSAKGRSEAVTYRLASPRCSSAERHAVLLAACCTVEGLRRPLQSSGVRARSVGQRHHGVILKTFRCPGSGSRWRGRVCYMLR